MAVTRHKRQELANNLHLQLAIYACLVAQGSAWPEAAFLILGKRALLAQAEQLLSRVRKSSHQIYRQRDSRLAGTNLKTLWKWRRDLLGPRLDRHVRSLDLIPLTAAVSGRTPRAPIERWQLRVPSTSLQRFRCSHRLGGKRMRVRSITAGAGTGKTTELTRVIRESIINGECRPHGNHRYHFHQ